MSQAILAGEVFEPQTIEFLAARDPSDDLVHAGAFFGDFLPALSRSRRGSAKVWAFEPSYESYRCANITLAINAINNVSLVNAALGDRVGTTLLVIRSLDGISLGSTSHVNSLSNINEASCKNVEKTKLITIDSAIPENRRITAIHLDVEGFETQALNGALDTIRRCLPVIILETMPIENWLAENLWPLGYRIGPTLHHNTVLVPAGAGKTRS